MHDFLVESVTEGQIALDNYIKYTKTENIVFHHVRALCVRSVAKMMWHFISELIRYLMHSEIKRHVILATEFTECFDINTLA